MGADVLADLGHVFLGSRLKRLAERLHADATRILRGQGFAFSPSQFTLLVTLQRLGPLTVGAAVEALGLSQPTVTRCMTGLVALGLIETRRSTADLRQKTMALTPAGAGVLGRAQRAIWPGVDAAVSDMCAGLSGPLLDQIGGLEAELARASLDQRFARVTADTAAQDLGLTIREYADDLAADFLAINVEWIEAMFVLEAADRKILEHPKASILDPGGVILFVESAGLGLVGTCALRKEDDGCFELTKMAVLERARGRKAGEFLLSHMIARARQMKVRTLYLLTNAKCQAAIHLYEKLGFVHDAEILRRYGAAYARCNVAMSFPL